MLRQQEMDLITGKPRNRNGKNQEILRKKLVRMNKLEYALKILILLVKKNFVTNK